MNKRHSIFLVIAIAMICALLPYSSVLADDCIAHPWGLVSWWPGDGNTNDIRNGNDGTLMNGAAFAPGMVGQAFSLNGSDEFVEIPDAANLDIPGSLTIDVWISLDELRPTGTLNIISKEKSSLPLDVNYNLHVLNNQLFFALTFDEPASLTSGTGGCDAGGCYVRGTTDLTTETFHHVAGVYDDSTKTMMVYLDGDPDGSATFSTSGSPKINDQNVRIGKRNAYAAGTGFSGEIDELEIFNRALSPTEIEALHTARSAGKCKPVKKNYGDVTQNGWFWLGAHDRWDLKRCDLTISYRLDMSGYVPPMWNTAWSSVGVGEGAWGWMTSGAPAAEDTNPNNQDLDDKLNLGAPDRYDEASYDATDPETVMPTTPIGDPWTNFGVWFDRDGVDPWQALTWGMIDGATYNTGGIYYVVVNYHALPSELTKGTMFATVNGVQTGFYNTWKNDEPDHYPVGKSITGNLSNLRGLASIAGENVNAYDLTFIGCHYLMADIDIKPGSDPNSINLGEQGLLPVAILGSENFDVSTINPGTINIGDLPLANRGSAKAPKLAYSYEDVNEDGYIDLMAFFDVPSLVSSGSILTETTTALTLTGLTYSNVPIEGTDSVRIVPSSNNK